MSFSSFKEVIEEGDTVILYIGVSQIYALEVRFVLRLCSVYICLNNVSYIHTSILLILLFGII